MEIIMKFDICGYHITRNDSLTHCYKQEIKEDGSLGKKCRINIHEYCDFIEQYREEKAAEKQEAECKSESEHKTAITVKKVTAKKAREINLRNGIETWEEDGQKTYWAAYEDESGTFQFDSIRERDEFIERKNRNQESEAEESEDAEGDAQESGKEEYNITLVEYAEDHMELLNPDGEVLANMERYGLGMYIVNIKDWIGLNEETTIHKTLEDAKAYLEDFRTKLMAIMKPDAEADPEQDEDNIRFRQSG